MREVRVNPFLAILIITVVGSGMTLLIVNVAFSIEPVDYTDIDTLIAPTG